MVYQEPIDPLMQKARRHSLTAATSAALGLTKSVIIPKMTSLEVEYQPTAEESYTQRLVSEEKWEKTLSVGDVVEARFTMSGGISKKFMGKIQAIKPDYFEVSTLEKNNPYPNTDADTVFAIVKRGRPEWKDTNGIFPIDKTGRIEEPTIDDLKMAFGNVTRTAMDNDSDIRKYILENDVFTKVAVELIKVKGGEPKNTYNLALVSAFMIDFVSYYFMPSHARSIMIAIVSSYTQAQLEKFTYYYEALSKAEQTPIYKDIISKVLSLNNIPDSATNRLIVEFALKHYITYVVKGNRQSDDKIDVNIATPKPLPAVPKTVISQMKAVSGVKARPNSVLDEMEKRFIAESASKGWSRNYITSNDTAKLVRFVLKDNFPNAKFSVVTDKYSGGSSINVRWEGGPPTKDVEAIAGKYHGSKVDMMQDMKVSTGAPYGNDYIFFKRDIPDDVRLRVAQELAAKYGMQVPNNVKEIGSIRGKGGSEDLDVLTHQALYEMDLTPSIQKALKFSQVKATQQPKVTQPTQPSTTQPPSKPAYKPPVGKVPLVSVEDLGDGVVTVHLKPNSDLKKNVAMLKSMVSSAKWDKDRKVWIIPVAEKDKVEQFANIITSTPTEKKESVQEFLKTAKKTPINNVVYPQKWNRSIGEYVAMLTNLNTPKPERVWLGQRTGWGDKGATAIFTFDPKEMPNALPEGTILEIRRTVDKKEYFLKENGIWFVLVK